MPGPQYVAFRYRKGHKEYLCGKESWNRQPPKSSPELRALFEPALRRFRSPGRAFDYLLEGYPADKPFIAITALGVEIRD